MFICAPLLVPVIAPGLTAYSDTIVLVMRVLLLQPLFLGLSSLCGVVTQIGHRFVLYALSPLIYNIGIILGIVLLYPLLGLAGLALGVVIGAVGHLVQVQLAWQRFSIWGHEADRLGRNARYITCLYSAGINLSVNRTLVAFVSLASLLAVGSVSVFQFAITCSQFTRNGKRQLS